MSGLGAAMAGGNPGMMAGTVAERRMLHPTPPEVTAALLAWWDRHSPVRRCCTIWEPAAGKGDMSRVIEEAGFAVIASDLHDHGAGVARWDFLDRSAQPAEVHAVITNPPFELFGDFFRRWLAMPPTCRYLAMLHKAQAWHVAENLTLREQMTPLAVLPITWRANFKPDLGSRSTMDVSWTVWDRQIAPGTETIERPLPRPWPVVRKPRRSKVLE